MKTTEEIINNLTASFSQPIQGEWKIIMAKVPRQIANVSVTGKVTMLDPDQWSTGKGITIARVGQVGDDLYLLQPKKRKAIKKFNTMSDLTEWLNIHADLRWSY